MFIVETLLLEPDLFDTYQAFDPSLWWNNEQLANQVSTLLQARAGQPKAGYSATGSDAGIEVPPRRLTQVLGGKTGRKITWYYEPMPQETYATLLTFGRAQRVSFSF